MKTLSSLFYFGLACGLQAQGILFAGSAEVPKDWWTVGWAGVSTEIEPAVAAEGQSASLALLIHAQAEAWSGGGLRMNPDQPAPVAIDPARWNQSALKMRVNGGVSPEGKRSGGQQVQVQCQFITSEGSVVSPDPSVDGVKGSFTPLSLYLEGGVIDEDESTWQEVTIPLSAFSPSVEDRNKVVGLAYIGFQFMNAPPTSGLYLTDIAISITDTEGSAQP